MQLLLSQEDELTLLTLQCDTAADLPEPAILLSLRRSGSSCGADTPWLCRALGGQAT